MLLIFVLPGMAVYYLGQDRLKKEAAKPVLKKQNRDAEIHRQEEERQLRIVSLVGKSGKTVSSLCKYGKITVDGEIFEAKAKGGFLEKGVSIRIAALDEEGFIVEPA